MNELTQLQQLALDKAIETKPGDETFISGVAGSGKSFVLSELYKKLVGEDGTRVAVLCPTNKAASVVRSRGVSVAQTIHSYLYIPFVDEKGKLHFRKRIEENPDTLEIPDYILVDECSMVGGRLYRDIMELNSLHKTRLVWFGDPYQLPPVNDDEVFARTPSVFLNEIHRTQADNPILSLAFKIRYGEQYDLNNGFPSFTLSSSFGFDKLKADIQFIAWTNVTRRRINKLARFTRGWTGTDPVAGDYVVCLENKRGMYNGEFFFIKRIDAQTPEYITALISNERINLVTKISLDAFKPDYEASLKAPKKPLTWQERKKLESERENKPILFDFAYCLTCHKSQGSEWPEIAIYDETWKMRDDGMKRRWLYTAVTRTRDKFSTVGG